MSLEADLEYYQSELSKWDAEAEKWRAQVVLYSDHNDKNKYPNKDTRKARKDKWKQARDLLKDAEKRAKYARGKISQTQRRMSGSSGSAVVDQLLEHGEVVSENVSDIFTGGEGGEGVDLRDIVEGYAESDADTWWGKALDAVLGDSSRSREGDERSSAGLDPMTVLLLAGGAGLGVYLLTRKKGKK